MDDRETSRTLHENSFITTSSDTDFEEYTNSIREKSTPKLRSGIKSVQKCQIRKGSPLRKRCFGVFVLLQAAGYYVLYLVRPGVCRSVPSQHWLATLTVGQPWWPQASMLSVLASLFVFQHAGESIPVQNGLVRRARKSIIQAIIHCESKTGPFFI